MARHFFSFASLILGLILGVSGCERQEAPRPQAPLPGQDQRLQFYFLLEPDSLWGPPPVETLEDELRARVVVAQTNDSQEIEKLLREWSARPADLLLLGPGLPQRLYTQLQLPQTDARQVLLLGSEKGPRVDVKELASLLKHLCHLELAGKRGCQQAHFNKLGAEARDLPQGPLLISFRGRPSDAQVWIQLDWVAWLRRLFLTNAAKDYQSEALTLSFSEGLLRAEINPQAEARDLLEKALKTWKLGNLSGKENP